MIKRQNKSSKRELMECLSALRKIKRQKQAIREHYSKRYLNESRCSNRNFIKRHLESCYSEDCNDYLDCCKDALAGCCKLPELDGCWDGVCDEEGCVFDNCEEEEFDKCLDKAIETLAFLVVPVRVRC